MRTWSCNLNLVYFMYCTVYIPCTVSMWCTLCGKGCVYIRTWSCNLEPNRSNFPQFKHLHMSVLNHTPLTAWTYALLENIPSPIIYIPPIRNQLLRQSAKTIKSILTYIRGVLCILPMYWKNSFLLGQQLVH